MRELIGHLEVLLIFALPCSTDKSFTNLFSISKIEESTIVPNGLRCHEFNKFFSLFKKVEKTHVNSRNMMCNATH